MKINIHKRYFVKIVILLAIIGHVSSCSMSYTFRTASIDYDLTKTLFIGHFINQAPLVYPPWSSGLTRR